MMADLKSIKELLDGIDSSIAGMAENIANMDYNLGRIADSLESMENTKYGRK